MQSTPFDTTDQEDLPGDEFVDEDAPVHLPEATQRPDYRAKDMELYHQWNKTKSPEHLSALLQHLHPIIHSQVNKRAGSVAKANLLGTAQIWATKAIKTYNPDKGAALSTHVASYLRKISRVNYKQQNIARLPENKQRQYNQYSRELKNLTDELARDPTEHELAERLGWSKGQVVKFRKIIYDDRIESASEGAPTKFSEYSDEDMLMKELLSRLTPEERLIYELKGTMPAPQVAKRLGVDTNRLNYLQRKLIAKLGALRQELEF